MREICLDEYLRPSATALRFLGDGRFRDSSAVELHFNCSTIYPGATTDAFATPRFVLPSTPGLNQFRPKRIGTTLHRPNRIHTAAAVSAEKGAAAIG